MKCQSDLHLFWGQTSMDHAIWVTATYIYFEVKRRVTPLIIWKYDVHTSNGLQDIKQNHWTMQYGSQWPTFTLKSNIGSQQFIIPKYDVHTSNGLQDVRQNPWTTKHGSQQPKFMFEVKRRVTRTHNLKVRCSYIKWSSRYKAKSLDHAIWVTATYIYFEIKRRVTPTHNPKVRCS